MSRKRAVGSSRRRVGGTREVDHARVERAREATAEAGVVTAEARGKAWAKGREEGRAVGGRGGGEGGGRWREWREWQREGSEHCREQSSIARATKHQPGLRIRAVDAISCDVDELARRLKLECTSGNADQRPSETWPIHYFSPLPR